MFLISIKKSAQISYSTMRTLKIDEVDSPKQAVREKDFEEIPNTDRDLVRETLGYEMKIPPDNNPRDECDDEAVPI